MSLRIMPVDPADFVVLAVSVVVALLGARELVTGGDHRNAMRNQQNSDEIPALTFAQVLDIGIAGRTLNAAVPTVVVVRTIAVVFTVGEIVLIVVRHQIVQGEAVVTGDEVNAVIRFAGAGFIQVRATEQSSSYLRRHVRITL